MSFFQIAENALSEIACIDTRTDIFFLLYFHSHYLPKAQAGLKVPNDREKLIEEAKKRINDFVSAEYDTDGADFSNLSNINVAYTTTEDGEHEIQASIDLENTSVVRKVDDSIVSITKYATLEGFVEYLNNLDYHR